MAAPTIPVSTNGSKEPASPFAELGTTGLKRFGREVYEEFDPNLRGTRGVRVYDEMRRNDPDVSAILYAILHVALGSRWHVESASEDEADEKAADFVKECLFEDMSHSWRAFIIDAMTSNAFGWAWFEVVYKQRVGMEAPPSMFDDGRVGIRKLGLRGQETLAGWLFDEEGGVQAMIQRAPPAYKEISIPISKSLLVRTSSEKGNPEGISLLRNAYRPYYIKTNMEEIEVIGAERDMTGVLKIMLPGNATAADEAKAREMGERYRVDDQTYFMLQRMGEKPHEQWDVDVVQTPGSKVVDTDKTITRCSTLITRSVLAQFLTLGQGRTGSWALSTSQKDLWSLAVKGRLDTLEDEINLHLIPRLFALNTFSVKKYPKLRHSDPGEVPLEQLTPLLRVLGELGILNVTQDVIEHAHERAGLPAPDHDALEKYEEQHKAPEFGDPNAPPPPPSAPQNLPNNQNRQHQTPTRPAKPNNTVNPPTNKK